LASSGIADISNFMEKWKAIPGFEGLYEVSDQGRVRNQTRLLRPSKQQRGHMLVALGATAQRYVHRLVLEAFVGPASDGMECRHLNGDPADNRLCNLAWGTRLENFADRTRLGEHNAPRGTKQPHARLNEDLVRKIRSDCAAGRKQQDVADELGIGQSHVWMVVNRRLWAWVE
jgi:hypothetical protein